MISAPATAEAGGLRRAVLAYLAELAVLVPLTCLGFVLLVEGTLWWFHLVVPDRVYLDADDVDSPVAAGTIPMGPWVVRFGDGVEIQLERFTRAESIELSLDDNDVYRVRFRHGEDTIAHVDVGPARDPQGVMTVYRVGVPRAARGGFDRVQIEPAVGDARYFVGHLAIHE